MSTTNSSTSIFPTKVLHLSDRRNDNDHRRNGFERLTYRGLKPRDEFLHAYRGHFVRDNYHGDGQYCALHRRKGDTLIDGTFYCNNVEGYGSETTSDGGYFEGLFKENARFGPGVMTYKDTTQDVGLWRGDNLSRLIVVVQSHVIPKLAVTARGKSILIQHRQLVDLSEFNREARMYTLLKNAGVPDGTLQKYQRLCNKTCRNKDSLLFDTELYDQQYFGRKDNYINVVMNEQDLLAKERMQLEQLEAEEMCKNTADVVAEETVAEVIDCVMADVGGPTRAFDFAKELIYEALGDMADSLERAQEERDLITIRDTRRRFLQQKYLASFDKTNVKRVPITHLVTWNNEAIAVDMLKHAFLHRNSENSVNFNVCRVLAGDRSDFCSAGAKERKCIDFLVNCSLGMTEEVANAYLADGVDVTVVDGRGNAGVHYAAARDRLEMIQLLTNLGAKLDCVNDEHLTALNMCLLRYLAVLYDVTNWEGAFLIDNKLPEKTVHNILDKDSAFNPNSSLLNVLSQISVQRNCKNSKLPGKKASSLRVTSQQLDIASMTDILLKLNVVTHSESCCQMAESKASLGVEQHFVIGDKLVPIKAKLKAAPAKLADIKKQTDSAPNDDKEELKAKRLSNIHATISVLLYYGAKPFVCDVPLPALHLAVYTENPALVELLLANGSDVNMTLDELNVTPLHVVATLPTSEQNYQIFKLLLAHSADVHINPNAAHWPDEKKIILGNDSLAATAHKNTLHILALRYDYPADMGSYLVEMARDLIEAGIDVGQLYLGHTALTLCLLRGNLVLARFLMGHVDVQQELGYQMGTALTVLVSKRYQNVFKNELAGAEMVDLLISGDANPFKKIADVGNVFDFINNHYSVDRNNAAVNDKKGTGKNKAAKKDKNKAVKKGKKRKTPDSMEIKNYIIKVSKDILVRKIQVLIVKFFIQYHSTEEAFNEFTSHLACFLNYAEFIEIAQKLIFIGDIEPCPCLKPFLIEIGTYINLINPNSQTEPTTTLQELVENLNFEKPSSEVLKKIFNSPEFDSDEKMFEVCFNCLQKSDKYLISCPGCGVVLFCSDLCNKADVKSKSNPKRHRCDEIFYNSTKQKLFLAKLGVENKFKQFQMDFNDISANRTTCLLGKNHLQLTSLSPRTTSVQCSSIDSKVTDRKTKATRSTRFGIGDSCKQLHVTGDRKICCKSRICTATELSTRVYSDLHSTKTRSTQSITPQQKKLSLMENLLKQNSNQQTSNPSDAVLSMNTSKITFNNIIIPTHINNQISNANIQSTNDIEQKFPIIETKKDIHDLISHQAKTTDDERSEKVAAGESKKQMKVASTLKKEARRRKRGGKLNPVLPRGYNMFFDTFANLFPDFDLTTLLLPYACYNNGQLYYRFLDKQPIFMETYSDL